MGSEGPHGASGPVRTVTVCTACQEWAAFLFDVGHPKPDGLRGCTHKAVFQAREGGLLVTIRGEHDTD